MDFTAIIQLLPAVLIGLSLGLFGSGGSILTIPVLVYVVKLDPVLATGYSLFIVGTTSAVGAVNYLQKKLVDLKTALLFSIPSLVTVYLFRRYIVPAIPLQVQVPFIGPMEKATLIMIFFAAMMLLAAISMIRSTKQASQTITNGNNFLLIFILGTVVGAITGLVSVGGGFLIIPALVLLAGVPVTRAVGTSLIIITANSFLGFAGEVPQHAHINWMLLFAFSAFSVVGIFIGTKMAQQIEATSLKTYFGYFILAMSLFIILDEVYHIT
jgi:uncharacterized protein